MRQRSMSGEAKERSVQEMEKGAREWINGLLGKPLDDGSLHEVLKNGVILCEVANKVKPSICPPPQKGKMPFLQMENISAYLRACTVLGLPAHELFQTVDLFEAKNMKAVLINLHALGRVAQTMASFEGPTLGVRDKSRLSVSAASGAAGVAAAVAATREGYKWPVQMAHDSMLSLLAQAAAAARKIARVKKVVADKARTEAVQKAEVLKEVDREYTQALQEAPQKAPELKKAKEQAEAEAAEAAEQAQSAQVAAFEAEEAAQEAKKAYDTEAALATASGTPLPSDVVSLDEALQEEEEEEEGAGGGGGGGVVMPPPIPPPVDAADAPPPAPEVVGRPRTQTPAADTLPAVAAALAPPPTAPAAGGGGGGGGGGGPSVESQLRAALKSMTAERDSFREMCSQLDGELREAKLREQSLRRMISLALEEAIPPSTEVEGASFTHTPAGP